MSKKVLIMSASTGGGHNRAARAIDLLELTEDDKFQFIGLINSRLRLKFLVAKGSFV